MSGPVVFVTGASRGIGRGVALSFLTEGATVYATGRTLTETEAFEHPQGAGSLQGLHDEAEKLPGRLVTVVCDHADDRQTEDAVRRAVADEGGIDVLVNNAWPGYERMVEGEDFTWPRPFWEQPIWRWEAMMSVGVRAAFVTARAAAGAMVRRRKGLVVNISFWAAEKYEGNTIYGVAKAAANKMALDFAHEFRPFGVASIALYPGLVRTEAVMRAAEFFDFSDSESPIFIGRVISGLWRDPDLLDKSGKVHFAAALAQEYDIVDIDGARPVPLRPFEDR